MFLLVALTILNFILGIVVFVRIHKDVRTNTKGFNHVVYPQASMQVVYSMMLFASWIFPMTKINHLYNILMIITTLLSAIFIFADGVTPAFAVVHLIELCLQIFLEVIFVSVILTVWESGRAKMPKMVKENQAYQEDNVGQEPNVLQPPAQRLGVPKNEKTVNPTDQTIPMSFEVVTKKA